jgi:predicted dehydrogenase
MIGSEMNRRTFAQKTASAAIIYKLMGSAPKLKAADKNSTVGLGFIGTGIRGSQLWQSFQNVAGVRITSACDLYDGYLEHAREMAANPIETTKDYQKILSRSDVDAVVIAVPDHWHHRMVLEALAAGKHVYIEKPMCWNIDQTTDLVKVAAKYKDKVIQVGSGAKTTAQTAAARALIKSGALGKVNQIRMENHRSTAEGAWVYPIPPDASEQTIEWSRFIGSSPKKAFDPKIFFRWRCWWEYSGGVATDLFVHLLTGMHEFMDVQGPKSVVSQGGIYRWNDGRTVPDLMQSVFEYPEGFLASMHVNLGNGRGSGSNTIVSGSEGTLVFEGRGKLVHYPEPLPNDVQRYGTLAWPKAPRAKYFEDRGYTADGRPKDPPPAPKPMQEIPIEPKPPHQELFIRSIRDGLPSEESAFVGHAAAGSAHLANLAFRKGRRMHWDVKTGKVSEG